MNTIAISGIAVKAQIYESDNSLVYRGIREQDNRAVILKVLKLDYPLPQELARYKQEYEIASALQFPGVIQAYSLEKFDNTLVIVFEDFGGESLNLIINRQSLTLKQFLEIAIKITKVLEQIHAANVIHKDINPANIVFNPTTKELKIIDFGIATSLASENTSIKNPHVLEGTLAYISPEQTGRMNRSLDYRTDFYSLGATFYELLTNSLPFVSQDVMELVHCHIALTPVPPHKFTQTIPLAISAIVMRLLAKTAEDRYQSARGIKTDLERCLEQLETKGTIDEFLLCTSDISDKFQISQKLYGRKQEVRALIAAFERLSTNASNKQLQNLSNLSARKGEIVLLSGYSGSGKTTLVQVLYKPITKQKGYFISGKFDRYQRNIPYSAIVNAFSNLVRQLLTENEAQLQQWQLKITAILGNNAQVIIDVIPELEKIIGKQKAASELPPLESKNRFNLVFKEFISLFTSEQPLVLFLDDLQWADTASLKLIELLVISEDFQQLLLIGAYRSNEVNNTHSLTLTLDEIIRKEVNITDIELTPLQLEDVNQLIADTLKCNAGNSWALTELVTAKTQCNPFFVNEFLRSLYIEKLLYFDYQQGKWQWDIDKIRAQHITDNVVELMVIKIKKLPVSAQKMLQIAAAIGNIFELQTLAMVAEKSVLETADLLYEAIALGLIIPLADNYKTISVDTLGLAPANCECNYKFAHDRIQQAAYSLIAKSNKPLIHWQIGNLLLQNTHISDREKKIFDIVNHLVIGSNVINKSEKIDLATLNLVAGRKAKATVAYNLALNYFNTGIELLGNNWNQYKLSLDLNLEAAEAAYLCTEFEQMESLISVVMQRAQTLQDKIRAYEIKIQAYKTQNKLKEAVDTALTVLPLLGVKLVESPRKLDIALSLLKTKIALLGKRRQDLIERSLMKDPDKIAGMRIMASVGIAAYLTAPQLYLLIIFKQVELSLKYGNDSVSPYSYVNYGLILSGILKNTQAGYKFGQIALNLLTKVDAKELKSRTEFIFNTFISYWYEHISRTLKPSLQVYQTSLEIGDIEFAAHATNGYTFFAYMIGQNLIKLEKEITKYSQILHKLGQETSLQQNKIFRQAITNLLGGNSDLSQLNGAIYNEEKMRSHHEQVGDRTALFYLHFNKLILCYIFGKYDLAIENAVLAEQYLDGVAGSLFVTFFCFYNSLAELAVCDRLDKVAQKRTLKQVATNQKQMQNWSQTAPMNYLHKFYLVEAQLYKLKGKIEQASEYYDRAIDLAKTHKYINEAAIANELAGKFYLEYKKEAIAKAYIQEAHYYYLRWGASAKVQDLEKSYPQFFSRVLGSSEKLAKTSNKSTSNNTTSEALDLATVIKASQAISSEISLELILIKLIKIAVENAGARSGLLILKNEHSLLVEASVSTDNRIIVSQALPIDSSDRLPQSIVNYVSRTLENVVLDDATTEGIFSEDLHIVQNQPLSVLCIPIQSQGSLRGILYLENNLTKGAFTPARISVLNLLCSQAAISIENAQLYAKQEKYSRELEIKVSQRTQELQLSQSLLSGVLNSSIDGVMAFKSVRDERGKIIDFEWLLINSTAEAITRRDRHSLIGKRLLAEMPGNRHEGLFDLYVQVVETNQLQERELYYEHEGVEGWFQIVAVKLDDGFVVTFRNVTERKQAEVAVQQANRELQRLATVDGLTQIANRRYFDEYLSAEWQRLARENSPLSLIVCDVDYFKRYNDALGHQAGDECLRCVAGAISRAVKRPADLVARYGGEEFVVILPNTDEQGAVTVAQAIAQELQQAEINHPQSAVSQYVTLSIGVAITIPTPEYSPEVLFAVADKALYEVKQRGRNRIITKNLLRGYILKEK
ncbi:diguanylate cyclase domain-containing protein [Aliterella atlantica]|uniref:diguanylate cyclase domain-containing protein n=1 Tax=Aliterella atlantica TaxID=1827278 RepID=UPI0006990117|nr:diguanylate cyclase [Aliterella atlantica]